MVGVHCPPMVELLSRDFPQRFFGWFSNRLLGYLRSVSCFSTSSPMHQKSRTLLRAQFTCPISLFSYLHNGVQDIHSVSYIRFLTHVVSHLILAALHTRRSRSLQSFRCTTPLTLVVGSKKGSDITCSTSNSFTRIFRTNSFAQILRTNPSHESNIGEKLPFHSHQLHSPFHCSNLLSKKNCIRFK